MLMFHLVHNKGALDRAKAVDRAECVDDELLVSLHVGRMNFEEVVKFARDVITFRHLRHLLYHLHEVLGNVAVHLFELDATENDEAPIELFSIKNCHVSLDIPFAFQSLDALKHGSGRKIYTGRNLFCRKASLGLNDAENRNVCIV